MASSLDQPAQHAGVCDRCGGIATISATDAAVCGTCIKRFKYSQFLQRAPWWRVSPLQITWLIRAKVVAAVLAAIVIGSWIAWNTPVEPRLSALVVIVATVGALLWALRLFESWRVEHRNRKLDHLLMAKLLERQRSTNGAGVRQPVHARTKACRSN